MPDCIAVLQIILRGRTIASSQILIIRIETSSQHVLYLKQEKTIIDIISFSVTIMLFNLKFVFTEKTGNLIAFGITVH